MSGRATMPLLLVVLLLVVLLLAGCTQPGDGGYRVSATFPRATALFEESRVKVMGLDVGHVERLTVEGDRIRADLRIDRDVPLPEEVHAAIVPLTLIGERNVVLYPAFRPGDTRIGDGFEIPPRRTRVTVEPDDVLETVAELTESIDAERTAEVLGSFAGALDGRGAAYGRAIEDGARIAAVLREHDQRLLAAAESLTELGRAVGAREEQLLALVEAYAEATSMLADERAQLRPLLVALRALVDEGSAVLEAFEETLPEDLAALAELALVLEANTASVQRLIIALPVIAEMLLEAYRPDTQALKLRFSGGPTFTTFVNQLTGLLGLPPFECVPTPDLDCELR
jgi:phospholipid/cholesterol/gamma-HCH transport system substrate-binding protein